MRRRVVFAFAFAIQLRTQNTFDHRSVDDVTNVSNSHSVKDVVAIDIHYYCVPMIVVDARVYIGP